MIHSQLDRRLPAFVHSPTDTTRENCRTPVPIDTYAPAIRARASGDALDNRAGRNSIFTNEISRDGNEEHGEPFPPDTLHSLAR